MKKIFLFVIIALFLVSSVSANDLIACSAATLTGSNYLTRDVTGDIGDVGGSCFVMTKNTALDCLGHSIKGNTTGEYLILIPYVSNLTNITIKNCVFDFTSPQTIRTAMQISGGTTFGTPSIEIKDNIFVGNDSSNVTGIIIDFTGSTTRSLKNMLIHDNIFTNFSKAIFFYGGGSSVGQVMNNDFYNNHFINQSNYTLYSTLKSAGMDVNNWYNNVFSKNDYNYFYNESPGVLQQLNDSTTGNQWTNPVGDNGYSDFCTDNDLNGKCDNPYVVNFGTDYFPLTTAGNVLPLAYLPPVYSIKFLGTDPVFENFLFRVEMQSVAGGNAYYAQFLDVAGTFYNSTSKNYKISFNRVADLDAVSTFFSCSNYNLSPGTPGNIYGNDGYLKIIKNTTDCPPPNEIVLYSLPFAQTSGVVTVSSTFKLLNSVDTGTDADSFSIYSSKNEYIGQLLFDASGTNLTVSLPNGTVLVNNSVDAGNNWVTVVATINHTTPSINWKVYDHTGVKIVNNTTITNEDLYDVGSFRFGEYVLLEGETYVDSISVLETATVLYPQYVFFDTLNPSNTSNITNWKEVKYPINGLGYNTYETLLWGTNDALGQDYYALPDYETFIYNNKTPVLTNEDVAALLDALNTNPGTSGFISGDLATDYLPTLWESIGIKSSGSKILIGFLILLIIVLITASSGGEMIGIFVGAIVALVLSFPSVGLFPVWFAVVEIIIAAALVAIALRRGTTGN